MDSNYFENLLNLSTDSIKNASRMISELDNIGSQTAVYMDKMTEGQKEDYNKKIKEVKALKKQLKDASSVNQ